MLTAKSRASLHGNSILSAGPTRLSRRDVLVMKASL